MNNILAYYYSLHPDEIIHKKNSYFFNYLNSEYVFMLFERPLSDADSLYQINKQMIKQNLLVHEIKLNNENRILCRSIQEWFKNNTNTTVKYSLVKDEFQDEELRNRYDMVLINNEANINNKHDFYSKFQEYLTVGQKALLDKIKTNEKKYDYSSLEESLFDNYNVLPLVFGNENIAISNKVSDLKLDGNGNIDFTAFK